MKKSLLTVLCTLSLLTSCGGSNKPSKLSEEDWKRMWDSFVSENLGGKATVSYSEDDYKTDGLYEATIYNNLIKFTATGKDSESGKEKSNTIYWQKDSYNYYFYSTPYNSTDYKKYVDNQKQYELIFVYLRYATNSIFKNNYSKFEFDDENLTYKMKEYQYTGTEYQELNGLDIKINNLELTLDPDHGNKPKTIKADFLLVNKIQIII